MGDVVQRSPPVGKWCTAPPDNTHSKPEADTNKLVDASVMLMDIPPTSNVTEQSLRTIGSQFGEVIRSRIPSHSKHPNGLLAGFVHFNRATSAYAFIEYVKANLICGVKISAKWNKMNEYKAPVSSVVQPPVSNASSSVSFNSLKPVTCAL